MLESLRNKKILLVVAHPDDELLGPGASMNRLIQDFNAIVRVLILGEGITSRSDVRDQEKWKEQLAEHKKNIESAAKQIGFEKVITYNFPDNRFDSVDLLDLIKTIEKEKEEFNPDVIFTHHGGDVNIDHKRTFEAVHTSIRPMQSENVKMLFTFETASGTEWIPSTDERVFKPNFYVEISETNLQAKIKGMESYTFEKRSYPHPRSPESLRILAQYRGQTVGVHMAEAFCLVRSLNS
ncbi:MAG: PIG-L family deacetylase [Crocinitomicaceae bacterium]|nr:PIG-L family deacetylase [Crocinitomicaceae bacterium]